MCIANNWLSPMSMASNSHIMIRYDSFLHHHIAVQSDIAKGKVSNTILLYLHLDIFIILDFLC